MIVPSGLNKSSVNEDSLLVVICASAMLLSVQAIPLGQMKGKNEKDKSMVS